MFCSNKYFAKNLYLITLENLLDKLIETLNKYLQLSLNLN